MIEAETPVRFVVFRAKTEDFIRILDNHPESPLRFSPLVHREHNVPDTEMVPLVMTINDHLIAVGGVSKHPDRGEVWIWVLSSDIAAQRLRPFLDTCSRALQSIRESFNVPLRCIVLKDGPKRNLKFAKAVGFVETGREVRAGLGEDVDCIELELT